MEEKPHRTIHEKRFLNKIGHHGPRSRDHLDLLKKYHKASMKRQDWGDVDKDAVINHVVASIAKII